MTRTPLQKKLLRFADLLLLFVALLAIAGAMGLPGTPFGSFFRDNLFVILLSILLFVSLFHLLFFAPIKLLAEENNQFRSMDSSKLLKMLEYTLDNTSELIYWIDSRDQISRVNKRALSLLGFDEGEILGQSPETVDSTFHPEGMEELRSYLRTGNYYYFESYHRKKNGDLLPVESILNLFTYGNEEYICAFCRDITERRRAQQDLKQANETFELFLEGLPGGAFVRDPGKDTTVYANEHLKNLNRQIIPSQDTGTILNFSPQIMAQFRQAESQALQDRSPVRWEADTMPFTGRHQVFEVWVFPLLMPGHRPLIGGMVFDITQRRLEQNDLFEKQSFLEATIAQSPVGIIILDGKTTNIRILNQGAKDILGIPAKENLEGKTVSFDGLVWEVLTPERTAFPLQENPLYKAFFHESSSRDEMILRRSDGQERFVMINSGPIYDKAGTFTAAIVAFLDITELKVAQDELKKLNRSLESLVEERTKALSRANQDLVNTIDDLMATQQQLIESEKMASLGELVAGVAHEINTPVGVSVTAASYLKESSLSIGTAFKSGAMKKSDFETYLLQSEASTALILTNLDRASNLIKSFKMISVDQSSGQSRLFRLKEYLEDVFLSLHPPDKKIELAISVEGDEELQINSYPGAFSQIITNLYMNSCLHGFEGRREGAIKVVFWTKDNRLFVKYSDNGKGMDEGTIRRIYEPFFTTKRNRGGSGLGMHIVFNLVNQKLGGTIKAQSELGKGTEFLLEMGI